MGGWIKLHRTLLDHWVFSNEKYLKGWLYMLVRANHVQNKVLLGSTLVTVERGEFITSIKRFSYATGMSFQQVRTFFDLLKKDNMINKAAGTKSTKITICNYDYYNDLQHTNNKLNNNRTTNQQQTSNKPATTDKNVKNVKNKENNIKEREGIFKTQVWEYQDKYSSETLVDFFEYWAEHGPNDKKMRFEKESTWGLSRRLSTWYKNSKKFKVNGTAKTNIKGVNSYWPKKPVDKD